MGCEGRYEFKDVVAGTPTRSPIPDLRSPISERVHNGGMRRYHSGCALLLFVLTAVPAQGREQISVGIPQGEVPMILPPGLVA